MKTIDISFKDFFRFLDFDEKVEEERVKPLTYNDGDISEYFAITPEGNFSEIRHLIKKPKQDFVVVEIKLPDGKIVFKEVSPYHIFMDTNNSNVFAKDCEFSYLKTAYGEAEVISVFSGGEDELYDISIDAPHHYLDDFGIIHHNSFVGMKLAKNAQKMNKDLIVVYIDTEMAFDFDFSESVGISTDRLLVIQSNRIEEVQQQVMAFNEDFSKEERANIFLIIDSWGGLVTSKTVSDATTGNDAADFTVAKKKNTFAKLLTGMGMTVFVINQVYDCGTERMTVRTKEGKRSLSDIFIGQEVLTTEGYQPVQDIFQYDDIPVYSIEMENGEVLEFTEKHKFLVERNNKLIWVPVGELIPEDDIQLYDDERLYTDLEERIES